MKLVRFVFDTDDFTFWKEMLPVVRVTPKFRFTTKESFVNNGIKMEALGNVNEVRGSRGRFVQMFCLESQVPQEQKRFKRICGKLMRRHYCIN